MLTGMKILLAEDNPTNQMVATQMLESLGATVILAVDGAEALESLNQDSFDAALIDIEMPRISGIDLIQRLRAPESPAPELPLIALTAYVMREHRSAIEAAGADGIIAKPILSIEQFGAEIQGYIRARAGRNGGAGPDAGPDKAATPGEAMPDGFDRAVYERLLASFDGPGQADLVAKVGTDIGQTRDRVAAALDSGDLDEIRAASHVLISVAGVIGAKRLQEFAKCLNSAGHAGDSEIVDRVGRELIEEADTILNYVRGEGAE